MSSEQAGRPTYTNEQIEQYLNYIGFPPNARISKDATDTEEGLSFLTRLIKYQLVGVPFENLDMHYSTHHTITLDVQHLFHKIVERACGKGGYCMENNLFFGTVLRSLGYQVMPVGARISSAIESRGSDGDNSDEGDDEIDRARYGGFSHTVNILTIAGKKYLVDVGVGSRGPTAPVPCVHGATGRSTGDERHDHDSNKTGGTFYRLAYENIKDTTNADPAQKLWVYSCRFNNRPQTRYMPVYCFTDIEFLPQDFAVMSFYVSQSRTSSFGQKVFCVKFVWDSNKRGNGDDEKNEILVGDVTVWGDVARRREYGDSVKLCDIKTERDRVDALDKYMGVKLTAPEIDGIKGLVSALG